MTKTHTMPDWKEFQRNPAVRKADFNAKTISVDVWGTLVHRSAYNAIREALAVDESERLVGKARGLSDVIVGQPDLIWNQQMERMSKESSLMLAEASFTGGTPRKPHKPARWCPRLYSRNWEERRFAGMTFAVHADGRFEAILLPKLKNASPVERYA